MTSHGLKKSNAYISVTIQDKALIFFVSNVFWVKEVDGVRKKWVTTTRDFVLQGHATL